MVPNILDSTFINASCVFLYQFSLAVIQCLQSRLVVDVCLYELGSSLNKPLRPSIKVVVGCLMGNAIDFTKWIPV